MQLPRVVSARRNTSKVNFLRGQSIAQVETGLQRTSSNAENSHSHQNELTFQKKDGVTDPNRRLVVKTVDCTSIEFLTIAPGQHTARKPPLNFFVRVKLRILQDLA